MSEGNTKPETSDIDSVYAEANARAEKLLSAGTLTFRAVAVFVLCTLLFYGINFYGKSISTQIDDWGVFGDYLGGVLNPAMGLATIYLVLVNARLQRQELANSIAEMKNSNHTLARQNGEIVLQTFQNTFFNWMNSYRASIANVRYQRPSGGPILQGAYALHHVYLYFLVDEMPRAFGDPPFDRPLAYSNLINRGAIDEPESAHDAEQRILNRWRTVRDSQDIFIGETLRSILGLLGWIETRDESLVPIETKFEHVQILRRQLSSPELAFLFYESWNFPISIQKLLCQTNFFGDVHAGPDNFLIFMLTRAKHLRQCD